MKFAIAGLIAVLVAVPVGYAVAIFAADRLEVAAAKIVADVLVGACVDVAVTLWQ
jgi:ABC-type phosphate transport system permease subunit